MILVGTVSKWSSDCAASRQIKLDKTIDNASAKPNGIDNNLTRTLGVGRAFIFGQDNAAELHEIFVAPGLDVLGDDVAAALA